MFSFKLYDILVEFRVLLLTEKQLFVHIPNFIEKWTAKNNKLFHISNSHLIISNHQWTKVVYMHWRINRENLHPNGQYDFFSLLRYFLHNKILMLVYTAS